jgi:hypothetical protein
MLRASSKKASAALFSGLTAFVSRLFHGHLPELLVSWLLERL